MRRQPGAQQLKQPRGGRHHIGDKADRFGKAAPDDIIGWIGLGRDRFGHRAHGLVQPQQHLAAKAAGKRRAGGAQQITDAPQPKPLQGSAGRAIQPQRRHRQRRQRCSGLALPGPNLPSPAMMREGPGRPARRPQPQPQRQAGTGGTDAHIRQHLGLVAPQMRRAGHVQHQPVRPLVADPGAIARGPSAQRREEPRIQIGPRRTTDQIRTKGPGIGDAHAAMQPRRLGPVIEAEDPLGIALPDGQRKGCLKRLAPQRPVAGQPRKPHADDALAGPIEHARLHLFLICS